MNGVDTAVAASDGHHNGHVPRPPPRPGPGMRPALLVVGIAVAILVLFAVGAALRGGGPPAAPRSSAPVAVRGTSLLAVPATVRLAPIIRPGVPPANIVRSLSVPVGTVAAPGGSGAPGGATPARRAAGTYDRAVNLSVAASQADVIAFYRADLAARGWGVFSVGPAVRAPGTTEVLGRQAGDDGWYWEIGVLVAPTTFTGPGTGVSGTAGDRTRFTLRLFQVSDQQ